MNEKPSEYEDALARIAELERKIASVKDIVDGVFASRNFTIGEYLLAQAIANAIS